MQWLAKKSEMLGISADTNQDKKSVDTSFQSSSFKSKSAVLPFKTKHCCHVRCRGLQKNLKNQALAL